MFTPNEIEAMPFLLETRFKKLEERIMADIIRRLKKNSGEITRTADWQIYRLHELGKSKKEIKKYIQEALNLSDTEIDRIYSDVLAEGYARDASLYTALGKDFIAFEDNKPLQQMISAVKSQTKEGYNNITQSLGFAVKSPNGKTMFKPIAEYYQNTLDKAVMDITSGAFDYNTVLKRTVSEMTNSGLRTVDYASGYSCRTNVAIRRAVVTGFHQVVAKINEDNAQKLNTNTFEVSWHSGHRPSHWWGGLWFTLEELVDVCGLGTVEGLCGANCYHSYTAVVPGISAPTYTKNQLEQLEAQEKETKEYNGKAYTKYEALQRQRRLESSMRIQRQKIKLLQEGEANEEDVIAARGKYKGTSDEYARFSKAMGLPQQRERVTVDGLGVIKNGKAVAKSIDSGIIKSKVKSILPVNIQLFAKIPKEKFTKYALDPIKQPDKARAFKEALGYTIENYEDLIDNIQKNFDESLLKLKASDKYGDRYELVMNLKGANGKNANVCTAWIKENADSELRLTSAYVTKKEVTKYENH